MSNQISEAERLQQSDLRRYIADSIGKEPWLTVYLSERSKDGHIAFFSALIPDAKVANALKRDDWDFHIGDGKPAHIQFGLKEGRIEYFRYGNNDGIEPFVFFRDFHDIKPPYLEVTEEFRHYHDLYYDAKNNKYLKIDSDGCEEDVLIIETNMVKVRLKEVRQFLAAKQMHIAIFFDAMRYSTALLSDLGLKENRQYVEGDNTFYWIGVHPHDGVFESRHKSMSLIMGKKLIPGYSREKCGLWPFDEKVEEYEDFIIGVDEHGSNVMHTCDPEKLANYFGKNPDAPHYLTPVFFRREVLTKYYANPEKFSVEDAYLRCGSLWGLRMDNHHEKYVIVYLGDLGRDLSHQEHVYWKSFNVPPDGKISTVKFKRDFLAVPTNPEKPDLLFKMALQQFSKRWSEKFGWPLFKPLAAQDEHYLTALHIPVTADQAEFDAQVLALAKILVDSLNEKEVATGLIDVPANAKGITKFELFLKQRGLTDYAPFIKLLRDLYDLRHGAGHRKSDNYEKIAAVYKLSERDLREVYTELLGRVIALLDYLSTGFLADKPAQQTAGSATQP